MSSTPLVDLRLVLKNNTLDPGASGGIDLDSDLIIELATEQSNLIGVKLT